MSVAHDAIIPAPLQHKFLLLACKFVSPLKQALCQQELCAARQQT
jgi:hypothetical protein